jgi:hypothetical protein
MVSNLALFCLATYLATFHKIGQFFLNHLVTLVLGEGEKKFNNVASRSFWIVLWKVFRSQT